jgi:glycosyltransferase involved in cell wall biosynthesis
VRSLPGRPPGRSAAEPESLPEFSRRYAEPVLGWNKESELAAPPLVSVITPAYNAQRFLGAAISSALTQTYPNVEIVVTDDGSTDRTAEIARAYGDRLVLVEQDNTGLTGARNAAMRAASGDYLALLDSDDILLPPYLDSMIETIRSSSDAKVWATSQAWPFTEFDGVLTQKQVLPLGPIPRGRQRSTILQANFVTVFSVFPRAMVEEIGGFDESLRRCEDWEYWARAILSGWRVAFQPRPYALYRRSSGSLSTAVESMFEAEDAVFDGLATRFAGTFTAEEESLLRQRRQYGSPGRLIHDAETALAAGDFSRARLAYARASRQMPADRRLRFKSRTMAIDPFARIWRYGLAHRTPM